MKEMKLEDFVVSNFPKLVEAVKEGELTEKEAVLLVALALNIYGNQDAEPDYSDTMVEDLVRDSKLPVNTVKGLIGSLYTKGYMNYDSVNDEYNVYYMKNKARGFFEYPMLDFDI